MRAQLETIPEFRSEGGTVYRGVTHIFPSVGVHEPDVYFPIGNLLCWYENKSTTENPAKIADVIETWKAGTPRTMFKIRDVRGVRISHFSYYPGEEEVLEPLLTEFQVEEVKVLCTKGSNVVEDELLTATSPDEV